MSAIPLNYRPDSYCWNCGCHFTGTRAGQKYCSHQCRRDFRKVGGGKDFNPTMLESFYENEDERRARRLQRLEGAK